MSQLDITATRSALRDEIRRDLLDELNRVARPVLEVVVPQDEPPAADEAELDDQIRRGVRAVSEVRIVTRKDFLDAVNAVFEVPLPPPPANSAEVSTIEGKATVIVATECPECGIKQPISVTIEPQLLIDSSGKELKLKAKAKGRTHICGQLPLPDAPEVDGQLTLDEADGDEDEDEDEPDPSVLRCMGSNHVPGCSHFDAGGDTVTHPDGVVETVDAPGEGGEPVEPEAES